MATRSRFRDRTGSAFATTRSCCCSTPAATSASSRFRGSEWELAWELELCTADPQAAAGSERLATPPIRRSRGRAFDLGVATGRREQAGRWSLGVGGREEIELRATYRLQLTREFGFDGGRLLPYLRDLGISHLYLSPSLQARHESTHGYDVIDPTRISDELGGERWFRALAAQARGAGMGIVLDIVPNHMAVDPENRFWADASCARRFFDIEPETGRWRRFADIDDMAGVRQEAREVFDETHRLILELVPEGLVDGLRIDHIDGLADPAGYLQRLHEGGARAHLGREDSRCRRAAARLAGVRGRSDTSSQRGPGPVRRSRR